MSASTLAVPELGTSPTEIGKRTKASRACDECRRKKIRCDIGTTNLCSSCQRLGTMCTFSRVQLKRGPSKRQRSASDVAPGVATSSKHLLPGINALLNWSPQTKLRGPVSPPLASSPPQHPPGFHPYRRPSLPAPIASVTSPIIPPVGFNGPEVSPTALNYYYAHWHPLLPVLPDTPAELGLLLHESANNPCLVTAINGTATSVLIEPAYGPARITQLMALIFVYCNSTEPTWLGAAAANAMSLPPDTPLARRLYFIVAILDKLHSAVFGTNKLLRLEVDANPQDLARLYLWGDVNNRSTTPPPDNLQETCAVAMQCLVEGDRARLERLSSMLKDTPFSALINRALGA